MIISGIIIFHFGARVFHAGLQKYHWIWYVHCVSCALAHFKYYFQAFSFFFFFFQAFSYRPLGLIYVDNCVTCTEGQFYFLHPNSYAFVFCSWLTALARSASTVLNKTNETRHSCLVLSLRGKPAVLTIQCHVGFRFFKISTVKLGKFSSIHILLESFLMIGCLNMFSAFFLHRLSRSSDFVL